MCSKNDKKESNNFSDNDELFARIRLEKQKNTNKNQDKEENKTHINKSLIFTGYQSKEQLSLTHIVFNEKVSFENCIFKNDIDFSRSVFKKGVSFKNTKFLGNVRFHFCEFGIDKQLNVKQKTPNLEPNIIFNNTTFEKLVDFYFAIFYQPQQFYLVDFFDRAVFSNVTFKQECQFLFCRVNQSSHINFESATFEKGLDISRSNFSCEINFWNIRIIEKNEIKLDVIFSSDIYKYDFDEQDNYISTYKKIRETYRIIKNNFYDQKDTINGLEYLKREMEVYRKELNFDRKHKFPQQFKKKQTTIIIIEIIIVGMFLAFYFVYKYKIWFWLNVIVFVGINVFNSYQQGITIKKIKENSIKKPLFSFIGYIFILLYSFMLFRDLYYFKERWEVYILSLLVISIVTILIFLDYEKDRYLLFFNKYSNNFGTNWVQGIVFTSVASLFFYVYFISSLRARIILDYSDIGIKNFLESYIAMINVIDLKPYDNKGNSFIQSNDLSGWSYLILFIGRIFISYGYYQTIQAFRKFGKL